jgi:2-methylcitrate dehydratase PrpD
MPDICLQHLIAVMLVEKTVSFRTAHDKARMQDPVIMRARAKVQLLPDEELEHLYPQLVAIVQVTLSNGNTFTQRVDAVRGTTANPMTRSEVSEKARDLMAPLLGRNRCDRLIETVFHLEYLSDIRSLRPLIRKTE